HRIAHLVAFGMLGLLAGWAFQGWPHKTWLAIALTSLFGASDEIHQVFVPGRRPAVDDWLFDTFSAAVALYAWPRLERWRPQFRLVGRILVGAVFAVSLILLARPHLSRPPELTRATFRSV